MIFGDFEGILPLASGPDLTGGELARQADTGTLDEALRAVAQAEPRDPSHRGNVLERHDMLEADLWLSPGLVRAHRLEPDVFEAPAPLRKLTDDEMLLLAGNNVTVTGNPWDDYWDPSLPNDPYPGGGGGSGGTPGQDSAHQQTEDAKDTACVNQVPAGVDLNHLNDLAKHMGTVLAGLQESTGWEWAALIYRGTDGQLYQSDPFTAQHHDDLFGASTTLPHGAHVVGYIHTHPIDMDSDQRNLSQEDRDYISSAISNGAGDVTFDTNLLAYITTRDRDSNLYFDQYKTYVYDKSERNSSSPGCDL